jgi:signal peptidase II
MAFFLVLFAVYAFDVVTKVVVRLMMPEGTEISLLPFFSLSHVKNTGIAFGFFQNRNQLFIYLSAIVILALLFVGFDNFKKDRFTGLVIACIVGGALGNLTDRILYGQVTDFLDFYWNHYHWPVFNIADSAVCIGATLLIWRQIKDMRTSA